MDGGYSTKINRTRAPYKCQPTCLECLRHVRQTQAWRRKKKSHGSRSRKMIREVNYTTWLANVVMVKKAIRKWRMCINYINVNKALIDCQMKCVILDCSIFLMPIQATTRSRCILWIKKRRHSSLTQPTSATKSCLLASRTQKQHIRGSWIRSSRSRSDEMWKYTWTTWL
ncbi:hypothetical protein AAZX31_13G051400 [Glycine max]